MQQSNIHYSPSPVRATSAVDEPVSARFPSGPSTAIRQVASLIRKVAPHDSSVLVIGESGTGKEIVARAIHDSSPRQRGAFVAVDCGAMPEEIMEVRLFGNEKRAFTGAYTPRRGRFEIAEGGTLFLDEIGDMSPAMQIRLLRVLQERVFEHVGSHQSIRCDVRIIAATQRNIEADVLRGKFRGDLFYRLNVFPIEIPSLRDRVEDIDTLVNEFALENALAGRPILRISAPAMRALRAYPWPGNVRELGNLIERLSVINGERKVEVMDLPTRYRVAFREPLSPFGAEKIVSSEAAVAERVSDTLIERTMIQRRLPEALAERHENKNASQGSLVPDSAVLYDDGAGDTEGLPAGGIDLRAHLSAIEYRLIAKALERSDGTVAHAARLLRLRRTTLVEKLRRFSMAESESCQG